MDSWRTLVRIETEKEFRDIFTDSEKGAIPPVVILYGILTRGDVELEIIPLLINGKT